MPDNYVEILVKARDAAKPDLDELMARLAALKDMVAEARATVDTEDGAARLDGLMARLIALDKKVASPRITMVGAVRAEAEAHAVAAALDDLAAKAEAAAAKTAAADAAAAASIAAFRAEAEAAAGAEDASASKAAAGARAFGLWGAAALVARARVNLFGGALNGLLPAWLTFAGGVHLSLDAALELVAVLAPAAIAFGAFAAAAVPAVQDIASRMQGLYEVSQATGQAIPPLTGGFARLAAAVKPQVYQVFGDALTILGKQTGEFSKLATGAGQVVDQLAARFAVAAGSGKGFSGFLSHAVSDLGGLGDVVGNLGGALGNLMKAVPGYAQDLLGVADAGSKVVEWATGAAEPVIHWGLAAHGAFLYAGLGATAIANTVPAILRGFSGLALRFGSSAGLLAKMGGAGEAAAGALRSVGVYAAGAAALPWGWIAIAAAGLGVLAYKLLTAKDATQQWLASLQAMVGAAGAANGLISVQSAQEQVAVRLAGAYRNLATAQRNVAAAQREGGVMTGKAAAAELDVLGAARGAVADLTSGQRQLNDETTLWLYRLGKLGAMFGSVTAAQGLLTAAGIKMSEMLDLSKWPLILQQVTAVSDAYQAMGQRAGVLGADLNALAIAGSDQVSAMSKLNQAWSTVIGIVSGGQSAFITFEQSVQSAAAAAKVAGASMNGLNSQSLALRASWQQAYGNAANLISALRMMSSMSPGGFPSITGAVKDMIAQLSRVGGQSSATRAEMVSLAQEVNPNIRSFSQLTGWLGHTRNAGESLNAILAKDGQNLQNLASDAASLGGIIQNSVTRQFSAAKMAANGTDKAIADLANAIGKGGASASQVHGDMVTLYNDLVRDGQSAQAAAALVTTLSGRLFAIPKSTHTSIIVNGASAASAAVRNFLSLLSQVTGTRTAFVQAVPVGGGRSITGAPQPSSPSGGSAHPTPSAVTLHANGSGPLANVVRALLPSLRAEIRHIGGTGPGSVQRALGQVR